ncbi:MAG: hypothetical protein ACLQBL_02095 [Polyangiaceae bacterium]
MAISAEAKPTGPQVTVSTGGYGQPSSPPPAQAAASAQPIPPSANLMTLQAEVTLAQVAAYERYLQYVALTQGARSGSNDAAQYFTNGAAATTVPTTGQAGSAYFTNGAEATRVPAPATPAPLPQPAAARAAPAPLAPFWWVEGETPSSAPAPAPAPDSPPPPVVEPTETRPIAAMSFEEWLESMGANVEESADESPQSPQSSDEEPAVLTQPSAAVLEVRQRVPPTLREKPRERLAESSSSDGLIAAMIGTFAAGLLLGVLAMKRPRLSDTSARHLTR